MSAGVGHMTATECRENRIYVLWLNCITVQSVTVEQNCCHRYWHSAASGVSAQPWHLPWEQAEHADPCCQGDAHLLLSIASDSVTARSWCYLQRRGSARADMTGLQQCSAHLSTILNHCTTAAHHQCCNQVWSSAEGPHHMPPSSCSGYRSMLGYSSNCLLLHWALIGQSPSYVNELPVTTRDPSLWSADNNALLIPWTSLKFREWASVSISINAKLGTE